MKNQTVNFDAQVQVFAVQLIGALSALSPVIIILSMLGAFAWIGYVDFLYFESTLPSRGLAILAAVFLQSMRFGTALGSVRMFKAGRISGILFLAASFLLTYLESGHVVEQAAALADTPEAISANTYLIKLAVWASIGLEFLVAILFNSMFSEISERQDPDQRREDIFAPTQIERPRARRAEDPHDGGKLTEETKKQLSEAQALTEGENLHRVKLSADLDAQERYEDHKAALSGNELSPSENGQADK